MSNLQKWRDMVSMLVEDAASDGVIVEIRGIKELEPCSGPTHVLWPEHRARESAEVFANRRITTYGGAANEVVHDVGGWLITLQKGFDSTIGRMQWRAIWSEVKT